MATKNLISPGIGFTPGSIEFIITRGLVASAVSVTPSLPGLEYSIPVNLLHYSLDTDNLHFGFKVNKLHYSTEGKTHYELPENKLHYKMEDE